MVSVPRVGGVEALDATDALIVGGSAAGLATAACLGRAGVPYVLLEQHDEVGHAWRKHYDRLHLHTTKRFSSLPGLRFGAEVPRYPSRAQVVAYLERYVAHHGIRPRFGERVERVERVNGNWVTETSRGRYRARHVIIASGYTRVPTVVTWPGQAQFGGQCLHSSQYRSGAPFAGRRVLVVGFGNSGGEIAIDLHEQGAFPTMSVRSPVNVVPREVFGIPILAVSILMSRLPARLADMLGSRTVRAVIGDIRPLGLTPAPYGPQQQIREHGRIPLLDIGTIALARQGAIAIRPGIERFTPRGVRFVDGREEAFDAVVLATGYRPGLADFLQGLEAVVDEKGVPRISGATTALPGLYFCGLSVSATGQLRQIGIESRRLAALIARDPSH